MNVLKVKNENQRFIVVVCYSYLKFKMCLEGKIIISVGVGRTPTVVCSK